jgi:hypothetical protein
MCFCRWVSLQILVDGGGSFAPDSLLFAFSVLFTCFSVYGFVFGPALSRGLLYFFPLGDSPQTQEAKVFSSNPFENLELVGFVLRWGCSKLGTKISFLFLVRLRLVRGAWRM